MATEVAQLIFKADTSQLKSAETKVDQLGKTTKKTSAQVGGIGRQAGMAGIQFEQLAGQIAGGQNPMRALGAQASDLGFILGVPLFGAVVGISAALLSMLPSLMGASESTEELKERIKELDTEYRSLTAAQQALLQLENQKQNEELIDQNKDLQKELNLVTSRLTAFNNGLQHAGENADYFKKNIAELTEEQTKLQAQIDTNNATVNQNNDTIDESVVATQNLVDGLREEMITLGMTARQKAIYRAISEGATDAQVAEVNAIYDAIEAKKQDIEAEKQLTAEKLKSEQASKRKAESDKQRFASQSQAASDNAANLALLQLEEDDRETQRFENQIIKLQEQKDKQLLTEQEYSDALAGIVAERARNLTAIELTEEQRRQDALAEQKKKDEETRQELLQKEVNQRALQTDLLISLEDKLLKGKSEKSKAAYRLGLNLANAERRENAKKIISSSYAAAMDAYKSLAGIPIIGPVLGAAAAGGILAAGVAYSAKSLAGRALGGQVRPGESYVVGERGPEVLTMGNTVGKITTNEALRGDNNTNNNTSNVANVSFTINANDTRGFDRLLQQRRGQIVNMINDALNENGKVAII